MKKRAPGWFLKKQFVFLSIFSIIIFLSIPCIAGEGESESKPDRLVTMIPEYSGIEVEAGESISMDLIINNRGKEDETLNLWISQIPQGWKAKIKTYRYTVTGISVPAEKDKALTFEAEPDKTVKPGKYRFLIEAQTIDGRFSLSKPVTVVVKEKEKKEEKKTVGIDLTTSYPVLKGPAKGKFEFSLDIESKLDKDALFEFSAKAPEGWLVNFKPAYETKYISSLLLKSNQRKTVTVEVSPLSSAEAGEYPIDIMVDAEGAHGEAHLTVNITGTYELKVGTATGLLSLDARPGKPANVSLYVKNTGTAENTDITFISIKPENWEVEFKPESIDTLKPGDLKQVEVIITPYREALVGDYSVDIRANGRESSDSAEFRVTVKASAMWGWIGIIIIAAVIGGLTVLFRFLGRR